MVSTMNTMLLLSVILFTCFYGYPAVLTEYYGKFIGSLSELIDQDISGVTGQVYAVNFRTIYIKDFIFDGESDGVYFYATRFNFPDERGFPLQDWDNDGHPLRKYNKEGVAVSLPEDTNLNDIQIFFVWNEKLKVSLGDVRIPKDFDYPKPKRLDPLKGVHGIASGNILVLDMQTLLIPNLYYHGGALGAKFWVSGKSARWSIDGETTSKGLTPDGVQVPDENGSTASIGSYYGKTIILTLPRNVSVADIGSFGIWDEDFATTFASIEIPDMVNLPPSMHMLKLSTRPRRSKPQNNEYSKPSSYAADKVKPQESNELSTLTHNNDQSPISTGFQPPKLYTNRNVDTVNSPQNDRDFFSFLTTPKLNRDEEDRLDGADLSPSTNKQTKLVVDYLEAPRNTKYERSDSLDKIYFPSTNYQPPISSRTNTYVDDDYDYDYETDRSSIKQSDGTKNAQYQPPATYDDPEEDPSKIKVAIHNVRDAQDDFDINSSTASLIGLRIPPSNTRSKNSAYYNPSDAQKVPQGAVLRKINGKWFYLVPAGND